VNFSPATLSDSAQELIGKDPCWSAVGVYGTGTCPKLESYVHCRNCPVYSSASLQLLNRPPPVEYRREWTSHVALERQTRPPVKLSAVLFRIQREWLALPTQLFQEVAERRPIHSLPHRRRGPVLGLANVRGELLVCVSLGHFLGLEPLPEPEELRAKYARLLVVCGHRERLAIPADEVHGPHSFAPQELQPPPATLTQSNLRYTQSVLHWQERAVGLLHPDLLFSTLNRSLS
jgi:chemotaxis-related protein WspD